MTALMVLMQAAPTVGDALNWMAMALSGLVGALLGGKGATQMFRLAMIESLRENFASKSEVVSPLKLQEKLDEERERARVDQKAFTKDLRDEFQAIFGKAAGRLEREHADLKRELERAIGALELAERLVRESGASNAAALAAVGACAARVEALEKLFGEHGERLGMLQGEMEELRRRMDQGRVK